MLVLEWSYFSGEAHLGYHQDTHLGARGALSTLRVASWSEKAAHKARGFMGKPACSFEAAVRRPYYSLPRISHIPPVVPLRNVVW